MNWENSKTATPLKSDFLRAWFAEEQRFFLTGGSALGMFYLDHRRSYDLDFFTDEEVDAMEIRNRVLRIAASIGAECSSLQTSPDFHRFEIMRGDDRERLDFVIDRAPQIDVEKNCEGSIRIDTIREIIANKWSALVGRMDIKDLLDLYFLDRAGHDVLARFEDGQAKDGGLEPGMLSHLLDAIHTEPSSDYLIEPLNKNDFDAFVDRIRKEMACRALPEQKTDT
jgi:hypothetical protein